MAGNKLDTMRNGYQEDQANNCKRSGGKNGRPDPKHEITERLEEALHSTMDRDMAVFRITGGYKHFKKYIF